MAVFSCINLSDSRFLHIISTSSPWIPKPFSATTENSRFRFRVSRILALHSNDIKIGTNIVVDKAPWKVLDFLHVKPGKGAPFVRTKLKNYITGSTLEKKIRAGSSVEEAAISKATKRYSYKDGSQYVLMDMQTYEETRMSEFAVGSNSKWLKEGLEFNLIFWKEKVIGLEVPPVVKLTVTSTTSAGKGDGSHGGGWKPATLETGVIVTVPSFVNSGDLILVDTKTSQYMNRASLD